ncbi:MAG: cytochrome b/b6 domain-containing protein [Hyphomicrobiales bacterium]|nr:MAG: cytochrome b/b6 domain-containing protein [Hyphomicrobiales bacterium]
MDTRKPLLHPGVIRFTHWMWALGIILLLMSGLRIYNAEPLFDFYFPIWLTLGGSVESANALHNDFGTAGALLWHFAAMWLLLIALPVFLVYGVAKGHFRAKYWPVTPREVIGDITDFFKGRLAHDIGVRNAVQKVLYAFAVLDMIVMVASGLVLWKPVQFHTLGLLMGQYEGARYVHFFGMAGMAGFIVVHLALVLLVPKVLLPMITGRAPQPSLKSDAGVP